MMRELAKTTDELIEIFKKDLTSPSNYHKIAELYIKENNEAEALRWLEEGISEFKKDRIDYLVDTVSEIYLKHGKADRGLTLYWKEFEKYTQFGAYCRLKDYAKKADKWNEIKPKAIEFVIKSLEKQGRKQAKRMAYYNHDYSLLVEIYMEEKEMENAWKAANKGGCSESLWLALADKRKSEHLDDYMDVYKRSIETKIGQTNNSSYEEAFNLLKKMETTLNEQDKRSSFNTYIIELKVKFKLKRNMMKLLDKFVAKNA